MHKIRVGVLRGGPSSEYEVSLNTGKSVLSELSAHSEYTPIDVFIDKEGVWHLYGMPIDPAELPAHIDVVFNAMHGEYGEDGRVQQVLESLHVPYTGSGVIPSALSMHKARAKDHFKQAGIPTPPSATFSIEFDTDETLRDIFLKFPGPYIIKPVGGGSSVGIQTAGSFAELHDAVYDVGAVYPEMLIERMISGKEATVGVIDDFRGQKVYALLPVEIVPPKESTFFDYDAKYSGASQEIVPGRFTREETNMLQEYARKAHESLGLRDYSRSDFIVTPSRTYILETNSLPGLTSESLLPKSLHAVGSTVIEFLHHTIARAHARR